MIRFTDKEVHFDGRMAHIFAGHVEAPAWVMSRSDGLTKQEIIERLVQIVQETVDRIPLITVDLFHAFANGE